MCFKTDSELKLMARNRFFKNRRKRRKFEKQRQYINQKQRIVEKHLENKHCIGLEQ